MAAWEACERVAQHLGARRQASGKRIWRHWARRSVLSRRDEAGFVGVDHGLDAVAQAELAEQVSDVGLDRGLGQEQGGGDFGVGEAGGEHPQHLLLAVG